MSVRKAVIKMTIPICRLFLRIFYEKKWLSGKWFEKYRVGYLWALKSIGRRMTRRKMKYPSGRKCTIRNPMNLDIAPSSLNCLQGDLYVQNRLNRITIGENCYIADHCGLITEQHDYYGDLDDHLPGKDITIGDSCWIGMNCVIMGGVELGSHTVVGANSVVNKSFKDGYVVIAGAPARVIKHFKLREGYS